MYFFKIKNHVFAFFKKILYRIIYRKNIKFGRHSTFRKNFNISIEGKGKVVIGANCFFNNNCSINSLESITIGSNSIFGESVKIYDHNHRFNDINKKIMAQGYSKAPVVIGKDCWIGSSVIILKGVTIGDNSIIGAGSIITENIPSESIVKPKSLIIIERRKNKNAN